MPFRNGLLVSAFALFGGSVEGAPVPLQELVAAADVIVVASLDGTSIEPNGRRLTLNLRRVHKGAVATENLKPLWAGDPARQSVGPEAHYGLWFLTWTRSAPHARDSARDLLVHPIDQRFPVSGDLFLPLDPAVQPAEGVMDRGADALDRVVQELRTVIRRSDVSVIGPAVGMARLIVLTPRADDHPLPAGVTAHDCPTRRLIEEFDALVALRLEGELEAGRGASVPGEVVSALCSMTDPRAASVATRLVERMDDGPDGTVLANNSRGIRFCASVLLRNVHPIESVPSLAGMLDSAERETQYLGLQGLADFASSHPEARADGSGGPSSPAEIRRMAPAYWVFLADPEFYLAFWRRWAADRRGARPELR